MGDLNRQQFCAALNISESTVRRMELDGLPYTPVGTRGKRYDLAECKRWLRANQCPSGSTRRGVDMSALWSAGNVFTESSRRQQLRAMPSALKRASGQR
jgi:phage terminase Nu1 subunit (DNA packaging protein)